LRESGVEYIDSREEQLGWSTDVALKKVAGWAAAVVATPTVVELHPKMAHPVALLELPEQTIVPIIVPITRTVPKVSSAESSLLQSQAAATSPSKFYVDFVREFQGGLQLRVKDGTAGTR
jgi:hypothetical protein